MENFEIPDLGKMQNVKDPKELEIILKELIDVPKKKGDELYDAGKYKEASLEYKKIQSYYSKTLGMILEKDNKDLKCMIPTLQENVKFWHGYVEEIEQDAKDNEVSTLWNDAIEHKQKGDDSMALKLFDEALEKAELSQKPSILNDKGNVFFNRGEYDAAINCYDYAANLDPKFYVAIANKALSLHRQEKFSDAIKFYKDALSIEPNYFDAVLNLGICYLNIDRFKEARIYLDRAYELAPKDFDANLHKAMGLFADGQHKESIQYYENAIKINPLSIEGQLGLAEAYLVTKQYELCEKKVQGIISTSINPTYAFVARLFLNCCQHHSNVDEANEFSSELITFYLDDSIDTKLWDFTDLRKFVDESKEFSSDKKSIILLLIDAFENKAEREKAKNTLKRLISPEKHIIFGKIGLGKDITKTSFRIKSMSSPDKTMPWYYNWEIFLDEPGEKLKEVSSVTYVLHPSFSNPTQKMTNKDQQFKLSGRAYGSFQVKVKIFLKNKTTPITQYHWLEMYSNVGKAPSK